MPYRAINPIYIGISMLLCMYVRIVHVECVYLQFGILLVDTYEYIPYIAHSDRPECFQSGKKAARSKKSPA